MRSVRRAGLYLSTLWKPSEASNDMKECKRRSRMWVNKAPQCGCSLRSLCKVSSKPGAGLRLTPRSPPKVEISESASTVGCICRSHCFSLALPT